MNLKKVKAIQSANKKLWLRVNSKLTDQSGIYVLNRYENAFKYAYVGQAKQILTRLADHLKGYQHIDLSIRKHGLYSEENPTGWNVFTYLCEEQRLNEMERFFIEKLANEGFQLRNKTSGGQDNGRYGISDYKESKGYRCGIAKGVENTQKEIKHLFDKYLDVSIKGKPGKLKQRAYEKFQKFLGGEDGDN